MSSLAESLALLPEADRQKAVESLSEIQAQELLTDWRFWARPNQLPPEGDWLTWLILAGRGFGKTRTGAEFIRREVEEKRAGRIALIAETQKDLEEVMVFGESGIASAFPPHQRPVIVKKPIRIEFHTGAVAFGYNATEPDQLRGPQFDCAWCDELAKWRYARETWDMLQFGMRLGDKPRQVVTTTPRPIAVLKEIMASPTTVTTRGSTYDNRSNLAPSFFEQVVRRYEGTRLGRQELSAEILDDVPGAMWTRAMLDDGRVSKLPEMQRIVVGIDPSGTDGDDDGDAVGIVVAGLGVDGLGYVIADRTIAASPAVWGRRAVAAYHEFQASRLVAERNFGGAMTINKTRQHCLQIVNDARQHKAAINVRPVGDGATYEAAKIFEGVVRHIEYISNATEAYDPPRGVRSRAAGATGAS
jgi:phage terminase large subunit-like protein